MISRGEQTIEWPTEENRQYSDQQRRTDNSHSIVCSPLLIIILSVLLCWSFYCLFSSVGHYIVCSPLLVIILSVLLCWSLYCLFSSADHYIVCSPLLVIILSVLLCWSFYCLFASADHSIVCSPLLVWPAEENRQYNDQQRRTDKIMTNRGEQTK
jgi:hypothetical protein